MPKNLDKFIEDIHKTAPSPDTKGDFELLYGASSEYEGKDFTIQIKSREISPDGSELVHGTLRLHTVPTPYNLITFTLPLVFALDPGFLCEVVVEEHLEELAREAKDVDPIITWLAATSLGGVVAASVGAHYTAEPITSSAAAERDIIETFTRLPVGTPLAVAALSGLAVVVRSVRNTTKKNRVIAIEEYLRSLHA